METRQWPGRSEVLIPTRYGIYCACIPKRPDRLWGPPNLGTEVSEKGMKLTNHLNLVPSLRITGALPLLPLIYSVIQKGGLNFVSLYFKISFCLYTYSLFTPNWWLQWQMLFLVGGWMLKRRRNACCTTVADSVLMNSRTQKILCCIVAILFSTDAAARLCVRRAL